MIIHIGRQTIGHSPCSTPSEKKAYNHLVACSEKRLSQHSLGITDCTRVQDSRFASDGSLCVKEAVFGRPIKVRDLHEYVQEMKNRLNASKFEYMVRRHIEIDIGRVEWMSETRLYWNDINQYQSVFKEQHCQWCAYLISFTLTTYDIQMSLKHNSMYLWQRNIMKYQEYTDHKLVLQSESNSTEIPEWCYFMYA